MPKLTLIPHALLKKAELDRIVQIKSLAWPYTYKKQVEWIKSNLKASDIHVLLQEGEELMAYLNLVDIEVLIDDAPRNAYGIGNVCARVKGQGAGSSLVTGTNAYLLEMNTPGLLFCKRGLVDFYASNSWCVVASERLTLAFNNEKTETMIFNGPDHFQKLEYVGKAF